MDKTVRAFSSLPAFQRQSFTFDCGPEFAAFQALEHCIGARSWFCDPSEPWQKGAAENANKRIFPVLTANTDLSQISQATPNQLTRMLNDQPRKYLGYKTPTEAIKTHLQG